MADDVELAAGSGGAKMATDENAAATRHYQIIKLADGTADSETRVATGTGTATNGLRVAFASSSTVAATQSGTWTVDLGATDNAVLDNIKSNTDYGAVVGGGVEATALRVTIANDSTGVVSVDDGGGSLTIDGTVTANLGATDNGVLDNIDTNTGYGTVVGGGLEATALRVTIASDSTGVISIDDNGSTISIDDGAGSITVDGTVSVTGVATSANQDTHNTHLSNIVTAVQIMDDWDETNRAAVNLIASQVGIAGGTGVDAGNVPRVSLATDIALPAGTNNIGDVDIASITAGNNLIGNVGIAGTRTSGGTELHYNGGTSTLTQISSTAAQLYWIHCTNLTSAVAYLQVFNLASASVTLGSTPPTLEFAIPTQGDTNGAGFVFAIPNGVALSTGLSYAITSNHEGLTTLSADEAILNIGYAN